MSTANTKPIAAPATMGSKSEIQDIQRRKPKRSLRQIISEGFASRQSAAQNRQPSPTPRVLKYEPPQPPNFPMTESPPMEFGNHIPRFKIYTAVDALEDQPPIDWVVEGLISSGSVSLMFGEGGTKKTYTCLDMGVCVALNKAWLERTVKQSKVLFVDEESGPRRFARRYTEVLNGHDGNENTDLSYVSLSQLNLRNPDDVVALKALVRQTGAQMVFIDALADIMPGADENSVKDVQPIFLAIREIAEETGAAVIFIHHSNKIGNYRGSSALKAAVDLLLKVESEADKPHIRFTVEKSRDAEPQKFGAQAFFGDKEFYLIATEFQQKDGKERLGKAQEYVLTYLSVNPDSSLDEIKCNATDCSPSSAKNAVHNMAGGSAPLVERTDAGNQGQKAYYDLTSEGNDYVQEHHLSF
jgi:hypothetical protein